jgi:uncharacterized lipoprotein
MTKSLLIAAVAALTLAACGDNASKKGMSSPSSSPSSSSSSPSTPPSGSASGSSTSPSSPGMKKDEKK